MVDLQAAQYKRVSIGFDQFELSWICCNLQLWNRLENGILSHANFKKRERGVVEEWARTFREPACEIVISKNDRVGVFQFRLIPDKSTVVLPEGFDAYVADLKSFLSKIIRDFALDPEDPKGFFRVPGKREVYKDLKFDSFEEAQQYFGTEILPFMRNIHKNIEYWSLNFKTKDGRAVKLYIKKDGTIREEVQSKIDVPVIDDGRLIRDLDEQLQDSMIAEQTHVRLLGKLVDFVVGNFPRFETALTQLMVGQAQLAESQITINNFLQQFVFSSDLLRNQVQQDHELLREQHRQILDTSKEVLERVRARFPNGRGSGNEKRAKILEFLELNPGTSIRQIAAVFDMPKSTVAYHVRKLYEAGLLSRERSSRSVPIRHWKTGRIFSRRVYFYAYFLNETDSGGDYRYGFG